MVHWPSKKPLTCTSPHHSSWVSDYPAGRQRWRRTPLRSKGGLTWSCKLFYFCAFRIASYFPKTFISAPFHLWLWVSEVKGFPRGSCQDTQAKEAFCVVPIRALLKYLLITAARTLASKPQCCPKAPLICPHLLPLHNLLPLHASNHEASLPLSALSAFIP